MILIPEIETVAILVPRTGSRSLKGAILNRYGNAMMLYRHMEADGVPQGYERWRKIGVMRHPVDRLWSLYKYLLSMPINPDCQILRDNHAEWVIEQHRGATAHETFSDWIVNNQTSFSKPFYGDGKFAPLFTVRNAMPETRKSQFMHLRPDLGTDIIRFERLDILQQELDVTLPHANRTEKSATPAITAEAADHVRRFFRWELMRGGYWINQEGAEAKVAA